MSVFLNWSLTMKKQYIIDELKDLQAKCENYFIHSDIEVFALRLRRHLARLEREVRTGLRVGACKDPKALDDCSDAQIKVNEAS